MQPKTMNLNIHYQVLNIEPGASKDAIRDYKDLVKVWHPDRFCDDPRLQQKAEEKLKQINAAYEFLKSYQPQVSQIKVDPIRQQSVEVFVNCEKLEELLELGKLQAADRETKQLLLKLTSRENEGWLLPNNVKGLSTPSLLVIDRLWTRYSNGCFGFSTQKKVWQTLGCQSSGDISTQTISENTFGKFVHWRVGGKWLSQWDDFNYESAPQGSLPREYIFALNGWWSFTQGWTGYYLFGFDEIFLKL
jgi:hypothetical protein